MSVDGYYEGLEWFFEQLNEILKCEDNFIIITLLIHEEDYVREKIGNCSSLLRWLELYINCELEKDIKNRQERKNPIKEDDKQQDDLPF